MKQYLFIALAGGLGSLARYVVTYKVQSYAGSSFPWGTLAVNAVGCFLFGLVWSLSEESMFISQEARVIILSGFLGAFTTFSTFGFETNAFLRTEQWLSALQNVGLQLFLGILFVGLGIASGRKIVVF